MADPANVETANAYQLGDYVLLRIAGTKPSACYIVSIEIAPMDIFPPQFNATWAPDPLARCMEGAVPYEASQAFLLGRDLERVVLHAEGGAIEVDVLSLPIELTAPPAPSPATVTADIVTPPAEATGYSESYDVGEAIRDAIDQLPPRGRGIPDWLSTYTVVAIGAEVGGIAGFNRLFARVRG